MLTRATTWIAGAAVAALAIAGCSSSGSGGDNTTSSAPGSSSASGGSQLSGDPVLIYQVSSYQDPNFAVPEELDASNAAVEYVNSHGGIHGHPLKLETCNGGLDPNQSQACIEKGIAAKATAFVGSFTLYGGPTFDALHKANIAWVNGLNVNAQEQTDPLSFPSQGGSVGQTYGQAYLAIKQLGLSKIGVLTDNSTGGKFNGDLGLPLVAWRHRQFGGGDGEAVSEVR